MTRLYGCEKLIVGRGATGISAVLETNKDRLKPGENIVVPANINYAAVYPIVLNGYKPVFVDVNSVSGNVVYSDVIRVLDSSKAVAVIIPHMYGNPAMDILAIGDYCAANDILLIEDCSFAVGAYAADGSVCVQCGNVGDYSIYSTGSMKTIAVGCGGFVMQNTNKFADLMDVAKTYENYPDKKDNVSELEDFFLKLYRMVRGIGPNELSGAIWDSLCRNNAAVMRDIMVFKDESCEEKVEKALKGVDDVITLRRTKAELYTTYLKKCERIDIYTFGEGSVPWKFCFRVNKKQRNELYEYLLDNNVPVTDCCPVVTPLFGVSADQFPGAHEMEQEMLNIPLLVEDDEIIRVCWLINNFFDE